MSQKKRDILVAIIGGVALIATVVIPIVWGKKEPKLREYTGRVINETTRSGIANAKVALEMGQTVPISTITDEDGLFHFTVNESQGSVRIRVEATGFGTVTRNVRLDRASLEDVALKPVVSDQSSINSTFPINPTIEQVRSQLANARGVRIDYGSSCSKSVGQKVVQLNGGQLTGKTVKEYLESAAVRAKVNFRVAVLSEGVSYEIVCH